MVNLYVIISHNLYSIEDITMVSIRLGKVDSLFLISHLLNFHAAGRAVIIYYNLFKNLSNHLLKLQNRQKLKYL